MNNRNNPILANDPIDMIDLDTITVREFDRLCHSFILTTAHGTGLDVSECELVCDDILFKIFVQHNFGNYSRTLGSLKSYLAQTSRNIARNYIRKVRRYDFQPPEMLEIVSDDSQADNSLEHKLQEEEDRELIYTAIGILRTQLRNPIQAEALVLNAQEEKPVAEVARILGMTPQQVSLACCRCRKMLRRIIADLRKRAEQ